MENSIEYVVINARTQSRIGGYHDLESAKDIALGLIYSNRFSSEQLYIAEIERDLSTVPDIGPQYARWKRTRIIRLEWKDEYPPLKEGDC